MYPDLFVLITFLRRTPNEATLERRLRHFQTPPLNINTEQRNHQDGEVDNCRASMTCNEPSFDTAADLVEKQLQQLVEHVHLGCDAASATIAPAAGAQNVQADPLHHKHLPPISSMNSIRRDAASFRQSLKAQLQETVCAVYSRYCPAIQVQEYRVSSPSSISDLVEVVSLPRLPNTNLLRKDGNKVTSKTPYHAKTTHTIDGITYCLQPHACKINVVSTCLECAKALKGNQVPPHSLVRYDCGGIPEYPEGLVQLRMLEERLLGKNRVSRCCYFIKPNNYKGLSSQYCHRAHVVAFPNNVGANEVRDVLLKSPKELLDDLKVVFLVLADKNQDIKRIAHRTKALHVRGPEVLKWATHLSQVYNLPLPSRELDTEYQSLNDEVPAVLLQEGSFIASTEKEAESLCKSFLADREGYANTRSFQSWKDMTADACDQRGHVQAVPHPELSHTLQTTPSGENGTVDVAEDTTNEGIMEGIDEVELQMSTSDLVPECVGAAKLFAHLHTNGVLVSGIPAATTPLSDYDPMWLVHSHPSIFPHGTGACPEGMSLEAWAKGILCRYPRTQYAQNIGFITDAFNIIQRHEAYKHAAVQMRI
ncbi:hypothetical protein CEUSTIGMA_g13674.t1 [Chlamydomonas eustigma]|uniref:DUF6570 domain-containing protein n=1 Tax=Chlamydomonas eustigma TaxID=1157962 RepID=A0A250XTK7_9CHLO|nr:hypothetical protein CEUSTIGMA_g13674.t1 [Chlamydomonas eustigma]|eukprot:GAX86262.1 hypothetical protein CEUSTIGMA_g13674.t1 [Chlamydomonas eustigma]